MNKFSRTELYNKNIWIFQANPDKYDVIAAFNDNNLEGKLHWSVNQHKNEIKNHDFCLIWLSGKNAGIYAICEIISDPHLKVEPKEEAKYWKIPQDNLEKLIVRIKTIKILESPLTRAELKETTGLESLRIILQPQGTNYIVKPDEWKIIANKIDASLKEN